MAKKSEDKVVLAIEDLTVDRSLSSEPTRDMNGNEQWMVESVNLRAGDSIPLGDLVPHQQETLAADESGRVKVCSRSEADKILADAAAARAFANAGGEFQAGESALPYDTSFSDHLVDDATRVQNLVDGVSDAEGDSDGSDSAAEQVEEVQEEHSEPLPGEADSGK